MPDTTAGTKDPVCGMIVDEMTSIHVDRDGKSYYFCSEKCRLEFLSNTVGTQPEGTSRCLCE